MDEHSLGSGIRQSREAHGCNQAELARRAGVTRGGLSRLESGKRTRVLAGTLLAITVALGVPVETLQGTEAAPPADPELAALLAAAAGAVLVPEHRAMLKACLRYALASPSPS